MTEKMPDKSEECIRSYKVIKITQITQKFHEDEGLTLAAASYYGTNLCTQIELQDDCNYVGCTLPNSEIKRMKLKVGDTVVCTMSSLIFAGYVKTIRKDDVEGKIVKFYLS